MMGKVADICSSDPGWGCNLVVECLSCLCRAVALILNPTKPSLCWLLQPCKTGGFLFSFSEPQFCLSLTTPSKQTNEQTKNQNQTNS